MSERTIDTSPSCIALAPATSGEGQGDADIVHVAPLSFGQQRMWLLDRLLPDKAVYNTSRLQRITGRLDVPALERALRELVLRHEILRTRIAVVDDEPRQIVVAASPFTLPVEDLSALPASTRSASVEQRARDEAAVPFDFERRPMMRVRLFMLASDECWLLLTLHHIATDRWSSAVIARELSTFYNAFSRGQSPASSASALQYADYASWQHAHLHGETLAPHLAYWKTQLADLPALALPTDRVRPLVADYASGTLTFEIDSATTHSLKEVGRREGATPFMTLLAVFQVLLYRYTAQDDIAVGVPAAGRNRAELKDVIGFFVNTLVMRGDLRGEPRFTEYLARVRRTALDAYSHQDMPFEKLVEHLASRRDLSRNPLFQVAFAFQNTLPVEWNLSDLKVERIDHVIPEHCKFDLSFTLTETAATLRGRVDYATSLFDASSIACMIEHWHMLVQGIVATPDRSIARLPLLTDAERCDLAARRRHLARRTAAPVFVHHRFEIQAARAPQAIALRFGEIELTYGDLNARANRLAHHLRELGVDTGTLVAMCLERSLDMIVAMLGVLKAGAAYVPVDPMYPQERLAFVTNNARASFLLTHQHLLAQFAAYAGTVVCLDRDEATVAAKPDTNPQVAIAAADLAYVIYTSGSTGQPKGVMITHANVARLFSATQDWFRFDETDVWTCFHSSAFDFSVWEIWGALVHGGALVLVPHAVSRDARALLGLLRDAKVTVLNQTPSAFAALDAANVAHAAVELALRVIILGGEALDFSSLRGWIERHGDASPRLVNMYGITETTVHVTYRRIVLADLDRHCGSMIGTPIPDLCVEILDRFMQPVPIGISGEIYIGGAGVARGYLNRPDLTVERFVVDAFSDDASARLYRSGDLARRRADGDLEYLGRTDNQVKIRGFRIEPAEVEAALLKSTQVREAVVVLQDDGGADKQLTAYVVAAAAARPTPTDLWNDVRRRVPDYMVPGAIVILPAMPLTAHGKIDRHALPKPSDIAAQRVGCAGLRAPPRDPLDHMLAAIWEDLLAVRQIGIRDNFFDLGGHSLLAAQMVDTVERVCGVRVPLTTLFAHATIEEFSQHMRDGIRAAHSPVVAINAGGSRTPMFFLHGDFTGGGFFSNALARGLGGDQPFYAVHPHGLLNAGVPDSIEAMATDRLTALRATQPHGPYLLGGHCAGALVALEMARQLVARGEDVPLVVIMDAAAPLQRQRVYDSVVTDVAANDASRCEKAPTHAPPSTHDESIAARHLRAVRKYAPVPFAGRLVVLRPESKRDIRPTLGWSAVNPAVEVYRIPGDHHTCITRHLQQTAATLKACLELPDAPVERVREGEP